MATKHQIYSGRLYTQAEIEQMLIDATIDALEYAKISPKFKIEERITELKQELESL